MKSSGLTRALTVTACIACMAFGAAPARAEDVDATRLDVERLPPEVIPVSRDMFRVGFYLHSDLGGAGFAGGAGRISNAGPRARLGVGYELLPWLAFATQFSCAFHSTSADAPPAPTAYQFYAWTAQLKAQLALGVRSALWLAADGGVGWASGDFLQAWGLRDAGDVGLVYGGQLGFDYHLMNAHHSLGLLTGALLVPNLDGFGDKAVAVYGGAYLKYVF